LDGEEHASADGKKVLAAALLLDEEEKEAEVVLELVVSSELVAKQ